MPRMDISEIRRLNLLRLIGDQTITSFAERVGVAPAYLSQIKNQADGRGMGSRTARRIEDALGLPHGSIDHEQGDSLGELQEAIELLKSLSEGTRRVAIAQIKALADLDSEKVNSALAENAMERDTVASRTYAENVSEQRQRLKSTLEGGVNRAGKRHKSGGG